MILTLEVEMVRPGLGKNKTGVEVKLSDTGKPRCMVPFSFYLGDDEAFRDRHGCSVTDLVGQKVDVACVELIKADRGAGLKIEGDIAPAKGVKVPVPAK